MTPRGSSRPAMAGDIISRLTPREPTTLAQLCADLGPDLIDVVVAPAGLDVGLRGVAFHDPLDVEGAGALDRHVVLAVGVASTDPGLEGVLRAAAAAGASAVSYRGAPRTPRDLIEIADTLGVAMLKVGPAVAWGDVYELIHASLTADRSDDRPQLSGPGLSDLFALADATAALAGGPITIEDAQSRVLAFSGGQTIDEGRMATVLDRRVPERWLRELRQHGILDQLRASEDVIHVHLAGSQPRRAVAIRIAATTVGSIWLAGTDEALSEDADEALRRAAKVAALHLMRRRATDDLERRLRGRALAALLRGHGPSAPALRQIGLPAEGGFVVVVIQLSLQDPGSAPRLGERLVDLVSVHLNAYRRQAVATLFDERVYVLAGVRGAADRETLRRITADCIERARHALGVDLRAGIGRPVEAPEQLAEARRSADLAVELGGSAERVVAFEEVHGRALLADVETFVAGRAEVLSPELRALLEHDREHATEYLRTLRCFLDALGNATLAAQRLHVHVNTVRYRMRRVTAITGCDLNDGDARLALELELRGLARR
jgi:sugar diacid utilization regulator